MENNCNPESSGKYCTLARFQEDSQRLRAKIAKKNVSAWGGYIRVISWGDKGDLIILLYYWVIIESYI